MEQKTKNKLVIDTFNSVDDLYDSIDEKGTLGLLAFGATGLLLWRKKREEIKKIKTVIEDTEDEK